MHQIEGRG